MGLFDHFRNSELAKARKESDRNPNPITIESYCRALIAAANLDEALAIDHATAIDREADRLLKTRSTQDHREAVRAFAEKREPAFSGR